MQSLSPQLTLSLSLKDDATFANFYPGKNVEVITELSRFARGEGERIVYICGSRGQGRSHLLQACCHAAYQQHRTSVYLPLVSLSSMSPEILNGLESLELICIDDLQVIAGNAAWEEAIFHLFNRVFDNQGYIILAGDDLPKQLAIKLPDLVSRLSWGVVYQLHSLTDDEKRSALLMRAARRGIHLSDDVCKYILTHCPRDMGALFAALDLLDNASLAAQRRLTIPFVKEVLKIT